MAHGNSPRHARKPKKARAKKPARAASSQDDESEERPPRGRFAKAEPARAKPATAPSKPRSKPKPGRVPMSPSGGAQRLQKLLASAGFGSRREVEQFLVEERVTANGKTASLGDKADPLLDDIRVDGERLKRERPAYWIVNKPRGVLTTVRDNEGRRTVMDLLPRKVERLFPVGRLDLDTSGLLLMTNDGDLAHALLHPSMGNEREYRVNVKGQLDAKAIGRLERGVSLEEGRTARAQVEDVRYDADSHTTSMSLTLVEGKKRQIRRSLLVLGFPVRRLVRVRMGPLRIGRLPVGEARPLRSEERRALLEHVRRLRAGEPVAAPARSSSGRDDLAAPPRKSGARRPARKSGGTGSSPSGPRAGKSTDRGTPPSGPRSTKTRGARPSGPSSTSGRGGRPSGPSSTSGRGGRPSGPSSTSGRGGRPSGPRSAPSRGGPPSGPKATTSREGRATPAGPRKSAARKKSAARRPSGPSRKPARKKAARKKSGATRRPSRGPARKGPGSGPSGRSGPRGRR